jgi:hypothetical protein
MGPPTICEKKLAQVHQLKIWRYEHEPEDDPSQPGKTNTDLTCMKQKTSPTSILMGKNGK